MTTWREIIRAVEARAGGRCEYCRMHQPLQGATFHVEHILPGSRGGSSEMSHLAWCCPSCNLHKADRIGAIDPQRGARVPVFNPRTDQWGKHFNWAQYQVVGTTAVGRAVVAFLDLNHPRRLLVRRAEEMFGLFPP